MSFLFDLVCIVSDFPTNGRIFSAIFAIINLAVRPFSFIVLQRELIDRGGSLMSSMNATTGPTPQSYEDIDRQHPQQPQTTIPNLF